MTCRVMGAALAAPCHVCSPNHRRERRVRDDHMAADAKVLDEDPGTGAQKYRYIRIGENHFSMAFSYGWMAAGRYMNAPDLNIVWI